jgi:hypothetical protein
MNMQSRSLYHLFFYVIVGCLILTDGLLTVLRASWAVILALEYARKSTIAFIYRVVDTIILWQLRCGYRSRIRLHIHFALEASEPFEKQLHVEYAKKARANLQLLT